MAISHLPMAILGSKHQRREARVLLRLEICPRLDHGAGDLIKMV